MNRFVVLSGCSGGGKSTLLSELAKRGYGAVAEPGRKIVAQQQSQGGRALPWEDAEAFLTLAKERSLLDLSEAKASRSYLSPTSLSNAPLARNLCNRCGTPEPV